ncbi:uncharacterized protein TRIADDRAFT_23940 [Trichoplax adhaerens]|uniref:PQ-loop repeat-containing protein 1 n=1 Tax=Trichoplax adhaerens TaxID=10228 RepID=B3RVL0_TRIAD|nr:hypothetical protein TRIADDRAFT_23940 [Trichoplax adhaerens]EDV25517.1 hypothetical protein TRIADDRAFT_23940 [Trichoplax adhaerens]|eukprot:XP_002111550.1 hypothetical protein TRIADDRAFT_23940 [Trichoplax adhaerens]
MIPITSDNILKLITFGASTAMVFGGIVPYIPQYLDILQTKNADGFSIHVCLALLLANTLRIFFWIGHPFEMPLLLQSFVMNIAMLVMLQLCVKTRALSEIIIKPKSIFGTYNGQTPEIFVFIM